MNTKIHQLQGNFGQLVNNYERKEARGCGEHCLICFRAKFHFGEEIKEGETSRTGEVSTGVMLKPEWKRPHLEH